MDTEQDDNINKRLDDYQALNPQSSDSDDELDFTGNEYSTRNYFKSKGICHRTGPGDKLSSKSVDNNDENDVVDTEFAVASENNKTECEGAFGVNYNMHSYRENSTNKNAEECAIVHKLEKNDKLTKCDLPVMEYSEVSQTPCGNDFIPKNLGETIECEINEHMKSDVACSLELKKAADNCNQCQSICLGDEDTHILNSKPFETEYFDNSSLKATPRTYFTRATDATDTHENNTGIACTSENVEKKKTKDTSNLKDLRFSNGLLTPGVDQKELQLCSCLTTITSNSLAQSTSFTNNINNVLACEGPTGIRAVSDLDLNNFEQLSLESNYPKSRSLFSESFKSPSTAPPQPPPLPSPPVPCFQLQSSCSSTTSVSVSQNFVFSPKLTNSNNSSQNSADKTKVSFSFPLKTKPNTGFGVSNVFSNMPASKNTSAVNAPLKCPPSSDSEINHRIANSSTACPIPSSIFATNLGTDNATTAVATTSGFKFGFIKPFKTNSSTDLNTNTATGNIFKSDFKREGLDITGCDEFFLSCMKQPRPNSSSFGSGKFSFPVLTTTSASTPIASIATIPSSEPSVDRSLSAMTGRERLVNTECDEFFLSLIKPRPKSSSFGSELITTSASTSIASVDCKSKETNMWFKSFGTNDVPQYTWTCGSSSGNTALPVLSKAESINASTSLSPLFTFGSAQGQNTSAFNTNTSFKPFPSTPNGFNSGPFFNGFNIGASSPTTSSSVLSNFKSSYKKCKQKPAVIPAQHKLRHQKPTPDKLDGPFRVVTEAVPFRVITEPDTYVRNGIMGTITSRHQHITAMPEYSSLSFEELRLQYVKYNLNKLTDTKLTTENKKVQTTEYSLDIGNNLLEIWKILECPVCLEIVSSPVLQCERGHHVCNQCWKRVTSCPLCKHYRSTTRNFVAEAMVEKLPLPCKHRVDGCMRTMIQVEKNAHEETCLFRTYTCLVDHCSQAHGYTDMTVHLKNSHSHLLFESPFHIPKGHKFTRTMSKHTFQSLVQAFDIPGWGLFFLCHKVTGQNTCLWMQVISTGTSESQFLYSVEIADVHGLRSVSYKGPVIPLHKVVVGNQQDCLIVMDTLLGTLKKNCGFHVKVSIWRSELFA